VRRFAVLLGLVQVFALGQVAHAASLFRKGPYLQDVTDRQVKVLWEPTQAGPARITMTTAGQDPIVVDAPAAGFMHVQIDCLEPSRRYRYTVEQGGETQGGEFVTAPPPGATDGFSFVIFGDTRSNAGAHRNLVERIRSEVPDFLLHTGDLVNEGSVDAEWQTFFEVERELLRDNVMFAAIGNHDRSRGKVDAFRRYFPAPTTRSEGSRYYAFTYGNSRFLILDSNLYSFALTDQTAWIERELAAAAVDTRVAHVFVVMHHPPYSTSLHGGHVELRDLWGALFEKYRVRVVFSGHDHTYEHGYAGGVHYVVSGGGGAPLYPRMPRASRTDLAASRYFERTYNYLRVQVIGDFVEVAGMRDDGSLIESFSLGDLPEVLGGTPARPELSAELVTAGPRAPDHATRELPEAQAAPDVKAGCQLGSDGDGGSAVLLLGLVILVLRRRRPAR
jgi:MYXO-CTERM domain-containing protein